VGGSIRRLFRGQLLNYPRVDIMIIIFGDFRQFPAEKWRFFLNANVMIKCFGDFRSFSIIFDHFRRKKLEFYSKINVVIKIFKIKMLLTHRTFKVGLKLWRRNWKTRVPSID
jgi:hypothetical protein